MLIKYCIYLNPWTLNLNNINVILNDTFIELIPLAQNNGAYLSYISYSNVASFNTAKV